MPISYDVYPRVLEALELISQGRTVTDACDTVGVSIYQFDNCVDRDPELQMMRQEAERRGHDALADALINIDNHRIHGQSDPKMAKVVSENIKWYLGKKDNKRFGDKVEVQHSLTLDRTIVDVLAAARYRVAALAPPTDVVDAKFVTVVEDDDELAAMLR